MTMSTPAPNGGSPNPAPGSTSSAAGSPASPSVSPAGDEDRTTSGGCGPRWWPYFAKYDPATCSWRTSQASFLEEWETFSGTWPRSGMTRNGTAYQRPTSARRTSANASGLSLPTPSASEYGSTQSPSPGAAVRPSLSQMARAGMWPTPTVNGNHNRSEYPGKSGDGLATAVNRWPTPTSSLGPNGGLVTPAKGREGGT